MQQSLEDIKLAMRILQAVNQKRQPSEADLATLRALAPLIGNLPPDELACELTKLALEHRARLRQESALYCPGT